MKQIFNVLKEKNIGCGYLYFYIHFVTEIACFYFLSKVTNGSYIVWLIPFIYDGLAFVPQAMIGRISDKYPKLNFGIIGTFLMAISYYIFFVTSLNVFIPVVIISIGNACLHISGAEVTLKNSEGKLAHSAIFVAGGSFGVISGKLLATSFIPFWTIVILMFTMFPFILLADTYTSKESNCNKFNYANEKINPFIIVLLAVFVVIIRGYMGYGIPTTWNKTVIQSVIFFVTMGFGKAFGGIFSDAFGIRKAAIISTIFAIPFLCFGDNIMIVSLIGVMFFSMTMSITLAILVSVLKNTPGLAFGLTTIGLFLGTAPIFFVNITNQILNIALIIAFSLICSFILIKILKKEEKI